MATLNAEIANNMNPNIKIEYISSAKNEKDPGEKALILSLALGVPDTLKLHRLRAHNANPSRVLTISSEDDFTLVEIFQGPNADQSEPEEQSLNEKNRS